MTRMRCAWAGPSSKSCCAKSARAYYITQVTAPTLTNDMYGVFLARSLGAITMAFGTHVTPMPRETMEQFPALDFVLRGEPELTFRELLDTLQAASGEWHVSDGKLDEGEWPARRRQRADAQDDERGRPGLEAGLDCCRRAQTRRLDRVSGSRRARSN